MPRKAASKPQATELDRIVDIFAIDEVASAPQRAATSAPVSPVKALADGARGLQDKLRTAAKAYLSHGNAAVDQEWNEF